MVIHGDCLIKLKKITDRSVDLIYLDPPFFTQKKQTLKMKDNSKEYSFEDTWGNINEYKSYIKDRLIECKRVLKNTGSIFLHCDRSASHYLRLTLDEVFCAKNFQSEIVWAYKRWSNSKKGLLNCHQVIFFYSKTSNFKFNAIYKGYSPTTNIDQIFQKRIRDENGKAKYKENKKGGYELIKEKKGVPLSDVWEIPYLNPKAKERVGYPTQKPIILLERIIKIATDENDIVLDPFCGSGTTLVAAKLLNRQYIGIDILKDAIKLTRQRLNNPIRSESYLLKNGENSYLNQEQEITALLNRLNAVPVQRNKGIDGFLKINGKMKPIPIRIQRAEEALDHARQLLIDATQKNRFPLKILIKTNSKQNQELFSTDENIVQPQNLIVVDNIQNFIKHKNRYLSQSF